MGDKRGLYIHIPFCVKKCNYCAFLSFAAEPEERRKYTEALIVEIAFRAKKMGALREKISLDSIYFGGGTPSVLAVSQMRDIMRTVSAFFDVREDAEITIEANPGTLGDKDRMIADKLAAYKSMGFNRLSMGVESMDNDRLSFLGRIHTAENVSRDVRIAREAGFDNINLDLIFSVPGESTEDALEDAKKIIALGPEHISCYSLQIEEGTPFAEQVEKGSLIEVTDEEDRETYHSLCRLLKDARYERYEISNFARPGYRSRHNSLYWDMSDYIACGLGASGFTGGIRYRNISDMDEYLNSIHEGMIPTVEKYENAPFDNISEAVFTGLRKVEGITYEDACHAYIGDDCGEETQSDAEAFFWDIFKEVKEDAAEFAENGFLIIDDKGLRLTERGIDISNQIMALFV